MTDLESDVVVHLLYNRGGCSLERLANGRRAVRDPAGANGAPATHIHFDNIELPPEFVQFLPIRPAMDGVSPPSTAFAKDGGETRGPGSSE